MVYSHSTKTRIQRRKSFWELLQTEENSQFPSLLSPMEKKLSTSIPLEGKSTPSWASQQLLRTCGCEAEQIGRKCKALSLHQLLSYSDGEWRGVELSAARRGGDDSGQFSPSGGVAAFRVPPSPQGSPVGPVVTSSLIEAGGHSSSCGDLEGGS